MLEAPLHCPDGVVYDDEAHTYRLDGVASPSVSSLLNIIDPDQYAGIRADVLARAAERGKLRHEVVSLEVRGILDMDALPGLGDEGLYDDYVAYLEWADRHDFECEYSERVVASRRYGFCGTLDLAGTLVYKGSRERWIVDLKFTAARPSMVDVQTEAYRMAAAETLPGYTEATRRGCLWISKGRATFFELTGKGDKALVISARTIHSRRTA